MPEPDLNLPIALDAVLDDANVALAARTLLRPNGPEPDIAKLQRTFTVRANDGFVESFGAALTAAATAAAPLVGLRFAPKIEKTCASLRDGSTGRITDHLPDVASARRGRPVPSLAAPAGVRHVPGAHPAPARTGVKKPGTRPGFFIEAAVDYSAVGASSASVTSGRSISST